MFRNRLLVVGIGVGLLGAAACNNDKITNLNKNPNAPADAPAPAVFTQAVIDAAGEWIGNGYDLRGTEWVAQHLAEVQYPDEDDYKRLQASSTSGWFDGPYENSLINLTKVYQKGVAAKDPGVWAPASILRTWSFSYLTNTFGDVPYFQALAGDSIGGSLQPAYDPQKAIYADFFTKLDAAVKALSTAQNSLGGADPIYGGDPTMWQKFGNSLRARLAMQIVNVDPTTANTELTAALNGPGGVFQSDADMAQMAWPGDGTFNNPWADNFMGRDDHRMSQTLMNILFANNDPRIPIYAQPTVADTTVDPNYPNYAGMPNGLTQSTAQPYFNDTSRPGNIFYPGPTTYGTFSSAGLAHPSYFMTYAEMAFIEAEASERSMGGLNPSQANGFYTSAIEGSMAQWGVTDQGAISAFEAAVPLGTGTAALDQIDTQEWVALYQDGGQAWALWRRTCQPATIKPGPFAIISSVPRRFEYSLTEQQDNGTQLSAAIARQGADVFQTRMYWDTNPTAAPTYPGPSCGTR